MAGGVDDTARIVDSTIGDAEVREYVTVHESDVGDGCRIYERTSLKRCRLHGPVDVNAGCYVENAEIGGRVQVGPNCSIVGVTHDLDASGMTFRDDIVERIVLGPGVFLGAGATVGPGVEIGARTVVSAGAVVTEDIGPERIVVGAGPTQRIETLAEWTDR